MNEQIQTVRTLLFMVLCCLFILFFSLLILVKPDALDFTFLESKPTNEVTTNDNKVWSPPDSLDVPNNEQGELIKYGRELVSHTAIYLGPNGKVLNTSNGMNCQNCHLKAGTKPFGNNYAAVNSTYPKFRPRSGTVESVEKRVNDCIERSLNGQPLNENSREMKAFVSYIKWVGKDVEKNVSPTGAGIFDLQLIDRSADPQKGKLVYITHCERCHGKKAGGIRHENGIEWKYPPLSGDSSYNVGAGLYRLSRFAGYVKANMPYGIKYNEPVLTDEECWDVAAYVNSLPRPTKDLSKDWPDITKKPFDHPFGPYADNFSEQQHKYGPFQPIKESKK
jgi:thiosulfate dehydrogenase